MALHKLSQAERDTLYQLAGKEQTLQAEIGRLELELIEVRLQLAKLHNKTTPPFVAPPEVLAMIFKSAHASAYEDGHTCPRIPVEVAVSGVCENWRRIALSISSLWTVFRCLQPRQKNLLLEHERLLTYLERSGGRAMELSFEFRGMQLPTSADNQVNQILHTALGQSFRWRRFVMVSDGSLGSLEQNLWFPLHTQSVPKLEYLDVRTSSYHKRFGELPNWGPTDWNNQMFSGRCPPLQCLRLDQSALLAGFQPRLENLVHLVFEPGPETDDEIPPLSFTSFIDIMRLPSLETVSLWGWLGEDNALMPAVQVEAMELKHFRFGMSHDMSPLIFLVHRVVAPKLETLTIQCNWFGLMESRPVMDIELSDNSFPSLRSLHLFDVAINNMNEPDPTFRRLVERTRQAKELTISLSPPLRSAHLVDFMRRRSPDNSTQHLFRICPEAEVITWRVPSQFPFPYELFRSDSWPQLSRLLLPPRSAQYNWPAPELLPARTTLEEAKHIGIDSWPPGYKWATSDRKDDPFLKHFDKTATNSY
ncbi:hypothetical protein EST38_g12082 [Candolleomyces aberdarensis]|uniref:F-box domain-containing protein n=1 Tax=Candolleomyces aberdarensis TaxID=2316362 RepID=A0A4Q2D5W9_9AGAR|nr:hypothetical protein EST38_g12082 [Candolleomyces aberdarensis]